MTTKIEVFKKGLDVPVKTLQANCRSGNVEKFIEKNRKRGQSVHLKRFNKD